MSKFNITEFDNGNKICLSAGSLSDFIDGIIYVIKEKETYSLEQGSSIMIGRTLYQCRFIDEIDHNEGIKKETAEQISHIESVLDSDDVEDIKSLAASLGLDLDDRKKKLESVQTDFIEKYKEQKQEQGIWYYD